MDPVRKRISEYRKRLRASGLRPIQIWVPDTRAPGFAEKCRFQSLSLMQDSAEKEVLKFIEEVGDWGDE